jgi:hypothetical protein
MGLRMLTIWDNQAKHEAEDRELRLAMLAGGHITPAQAFPDRFVKAVEEPEDEASDVGPYEYESPGPDGSNYDMVMAELERHRRVTTREGSETSEEVTEGFSLEPDDAEWI